MESSKDSSNESIKYDIEAPKKALHLIESNPLLLKIFLKIARQRARENYEKSGLGREIQPDEKVLDIGTGTGHIAQLIEQKNRAKVFKMNLGDLRAIDTKDNQFVIADALRLPFQEASFDVVSLIDVLHHCTNQEEILREALRILKPGGKIIMIEDVLPEKRVSRQRFMVKETLKVIDNLLNQQSAKSNPFNFHSEEEWKEKLTQIGFISPVTRAWHWELGDFVPLLGQLTKNLSLSLLRPLTEGIITAKKPL